MHDELNISGVLCSGYESFFDAEKKIADYILENKTQVIDMTVAELAQASGTSDATVSRFCRRLGLSGFHQLKIRLAGEVANERGNSVTISNDIVRGDIPQTLQNILANKVAELTQTVGMMDPVQLNEILTLIENAGTVQLAAVGNTIPVAMDGAFKFNQIGIPAVANTIWESQVAYTCNLKVGDVVIIISNSGVSRRLKILMDCARESGVQTIVVTNNVGTPLAQSADYRIATATREKLLMGEFCFSRVSATMVIEILYLLLAAGKQDSNEHIRRHEIAIGDDKI